MKKLVSVLLSLAMSATVCSIAFASNQIINPKPIGALDGVIGAILGVVQVIGYAFAMGMLLYVGIKYTMASANEKADLKKGSISYVIGAVIIFGASALLGILQNLGTEVTG